MLSEKKRTTTASRGLHSAALHATPDALVGHERQLFLINFAHFGVAPPTFLFKFQWLENIYNKK
jgi:hypothetical protein